MPTRLHRGGRRILEFRIPTLASAGTSWRRPMSPPTASTSLRAAFDKTIADPEFLAEPPKLGLEIMPPERRDMQEVVARHRLHPAGSAQRVKAHRQPMSIA